ncbi:MAG: transcriptional repressor [Clostridiaceae bacterium]|nr:transcriptional repressor [Clostridiaceae bacterium]
MIKTRNTKQKEKIIKYLKENKNKHLTIQEIQNALEDQIGLTTIYRMVNCLVEKGEIIKIPLDNKQGFCYQYKEHTAECESHYHLICEECGDLIHFKSDKVLNIIEQAQEDKKFFINNEKVVFYGKCKECQKNNK